MTALQYLLDTNICVFVIRQKPTVALQRFQQYPPDELAISAITLAELRFGADKSSDPPRNHAALDRFLAPLEIVDFDADASDWYGKVRSDLQARGCPIGPLDTLIAAHALRLGLPLATNNVREFGRVTGLQVEDWTVP